MDELTFLAKTERLFLLFSMLPEVGDRQPLIDAAVCEVRSQLRPDADTFDVRLCYYAAAVANLRYRQMIAAQAAVSPTYAGSVTAQRNDSLPCSFSERLVSEYRKAAADLLTDGAFVFTGVR